MFAKPTARVALVSAASTFTPHSRAGNTRGDMPARPGLSPLRFTTTYVITPARMADLKRVASELSGNPPAAGDTLNFGGRRYVSGAVAATRTKPDKQDVEEIARVVRSAATLSDIVIVSLHCHEGGADRSVPGADATRILEMMTTRSKARGVNVTVKGGVGYVVPTP